MDVIAASLVSIWAETADYTISQYEMCVGVGDFPLIKKKQQHEQKRRQKLKQNIAAASFLGLPLFLPLAVSPSLSLPLFLKIFLAFYTPPSLIYI